MGNYERRLHELGISLPEIPSPAGAYIPAVQTGNLVFFSGQGPFKDGEFTHTGQVGKELTLEEGYQAARTSAINCLAEIISLTG